MPSHQAKTLTKSVISLQTIMILLQKHFHTSYFAFIKKSSNCSNDSLANPWHSKSSPQAFCSNSQCEVLVGHFSQTLQSSCSHKSSIGFKSGDCGGQSIIDSTPPDSFFSRYRLHNFEVCFGSLSCYITKLAPIKCFPDGMACRCRIE